MCIKVPQIKTEMNKIKAFHVCLLIMSAVQKIFFTIFLQAFLAQSFVSSCLFQCLAESGPHGSNNHSVMSPGNTEWETGAGGWPNNPVQILLKSLKINLSADPYDFPLATDVESFPNEGDTIAVAWVWRIEDTPAGGEVWKF